MSKGIIIDKKRHPARSTNAVGGGEGIGSIQIDNADGELTGAVRNGSERTKVEPTKDGSNGDGQIGTWDERHGKIDVEDQ